MRDNLLETLLGFAASKQCYEEDPFTEVLAWLLRAESALRDSFSELLATSVTRTRGRSLQFRAETVRTQVVVRHGDGDFSRYDLVLESAGMRAVVEVKIRAELTPTIAELGGRVEPLVSARHQIHNYLALAEERADSGEVQYVFGLAIALKDAGEKVAPHRCWGGWLTWQAVYDAFEKTLDSNRGASIDPAARAMAEQLLGVMEVRGMATQKMTLEGAISVRRASRFRQSIRVALESTWNELYADQMLKGFIKHNRSAWEESDSLSRMGFRLWVNATDTDHFGYIGLSYGDRTLVEDVPDLCFFLQAKPESAAAKELLQQRDRVVDLVAQLDRREPLSDGTTRRCPEAGRRSGAERASVMFFWTVIPPARQQRTFAG